MQQSNTVGYTSGTGSDSLSDFSRTAAPTAHM